MFGRGKHEKRSDVELFTVYDSKTGIYELPNPAQNREDMIRAVLNMFRGPEGRMHRYFLNAEDFALFSIGGYDKLSGAIEAWPPKHVANFHELRRLVELDRPVQGSLNGQGNQPAQDLGIVPT